MSASSIGDISALRIIDKKVLRTLVPYSLQHIYRMEIAGEFPQRLQLGQNRVGWRLSDIEEWIRSRPVAPLRRKRKP
jgi:prophage regulatory protein